jgi:hypothetical protein
LPPGLHPLVLRRRVHGDLSSCAKGTVCKLTSAKLRPDGRLRADSSTCIFTRESIPGVVT